VKKEFIERVQLAWAILWSKDTGLVHYVREEISRADESVALNCANVARVLSLEGHSGGSASIVLPWLAKALQWLPVTPLTGEDSEWEVVAGNSGGYTYQNKRCSRVFKGPDGEGYDIDGKVFIESSGVAYTNYESRTPVVFPYTPTTEYINVEAEENENE